MHMIKKAYIVLANGQIFEGKTFGASGCITGEAVFTTGMTGYLETLTDPSYYGQIVMQTFPLVGNYGVISKDFESAQPHVRAYIVREKCDLPSNFRCENSLESFLLKHSIIGVYDVDTRQLTKIIRESGVMNARIIALSGDNTKDQPALKELEIFNNPTTKDQYLAQIASYTIVDAVKTVTCNACKIEENAEVVFKNSATYRAVPVTPEGLKINDQVEAAKKVKNPDGTNKKVVLWDFGAKANIRRELLKRGLDVISLPSTATAKEILAIKPDGIMLSNGPGDPAQNTEIIAQLSELTKTGIPLFGICLGHQLLALARGAKTEKLKYGHRGANQPVKQLTTGRVYISSQNHGYAVVSDSLPKGAHLSFINTNDNTCEGIAYSDIKAFSIQFHPEASGGPLDTGFLFDDFVSIINGEPVPGIQA